MSELIEKNIPFLAIVMYERSVAAELQEMIDKGEVFEIQCLSRRFFGMLTAGRSSGAEDSW